MQRIKVAPSEDWWKAIDDQAELACVAAELVWNAKAYYSLTHKEVDTVRDAAKNLHQMHLDALQAVIDNEWFDDFGILETEKEHIVESWKAKEPGLVGRFDLAYDGTSAPKLLEYNADTPALLFETGLLEPGWKKDNFPKHSSFNQLEQSLIQAWKSLALGSEVLHLAALKGIEYDEITTRFISRCAVKAGIEVRLMAIEDLFWSEEEGEFKDEFGCKVEALYKFYPWDWVYLNEDAKSFKRDNIRTIEPAWKSLISNKAMLAILWRLYPEHPNLLPAYFSPDKLGSSYVEKPFRSRQGENVTIYKDGTEYGLPGSYADEPRVYQAYCPIAQFDSRYAIVGAWIVSNEPCGLSIRESRSPITSNGSIFSPHIIDG